MKPRRPLEPMPPDLAPEYDEYMDDAVALADGRLSPARAAEVRARMASDPMYRTVVQQVLDSWKAPPLNKDELHQQLGEFWKRAGVVPPPVVEDPDLSAYRERVKQRTGRNWRLRNVVAAVLALFLIGPIGLWGYIDLRYFEKVSSKPNVVSTVRLPDQSLVQLAPSSSVRYHKKIDERRTRWVDLEGEGTFTVVPVNNATFVVQTTFANITVLGTRFTVQAHEGSTQVQVEEGRVSLQPKDEDGEPKGKPVLLGAGDRASVTKAGIVSDLPTPPASGLKP